MLWTDEPITDLTQDTLGRQGFTARLADLIERSHDPDSSIVIGLTGAWGSGKTSAFTLASAQLDQAKWSVAKLNPWAAADDDSMLAEFFSALSSVLPSQRGSNLRKNLAVCASLVGPGLSAIPVAGNAASRYAEKLEKHLTARKPWPDAFKDASDGFRALGQRILVFVDDCDRLDPTELRTLLKVIRLVGRFPGVTYVLAYDEETLSHTLSAAGVGHNSAVSAQRYLEKIVQFIFPMPRLTTSEVLARLTGSLGPVLRECGWDPEVLSEYRLTKAFDDVVLRRLATPRSIDRFVAQARNLLAHLDPAEFDAIDLLILLFVRLQFPEGYAQLPHWRPTLLGSGRFGTNPWEPGSGNPVDWTQLLRYAGERTEDQQDFQLSLQSVFPAFQETFVTDGLVRACTSLYFERHLLFEVPKGEVRETDVTGALISANTTPPDFSSLDALLSPADPTHAVALQKLRRGTEEWHEGDVTLEFALHIADLHVSLQDDLDTAHFGSSLLFWLAALLPLLKGVVDVSTLLGALRDHLGDETTALLAKRMLSLTTNDGWAQEVTQAVADMCISSALQQLRDGDQAPLGSHIQSYVGFLLSLGRLDRLPDLVRQALANQEITLDGVAARCVSVITSYNDGSTRLDKVDTTLLQSLTGETDISDPSTDSWPDRFDLTWPNRREWARWVLGPGRTTGIPDQ